MPKDTNLTLTFGDWTPVNDNGQDTMRLQARGYGIELAATGSAGTPPSGDFSTVTIEPGDGAVTFSIAAYWPGVPGANTLWARPLVVGGGVSVSHA